MGLLDLNFWRFNWDRSKATRSLKCENSKRWHMINIEQRQLYFCFSTFWTLSGQLFSLNNSSCNQGWYLTTCREWRQCSHCPPPHPCLSGCVFYFPLLWRLHLLPRIPFRPEEWVLSPIDRNNPQGSALRGSCGWRALSHSRPCAHWGSCLQRPAEAKVQRWSSPWARPRAPCDISEDFIKGL